MHGLHGHLYSMLHSDVDGSMGILPLHLHHAMRLYLWPMITAAVALEVTWYKLVQRRAYPWREMLTSAIVYVMRLPMALLRPVVVAPIAYVLWTHRLTTVPLDTVWGIALLFLGEELAYYWMHRASHRVRWLWASHLVHHTPEHIHLASAFRLGITELLSGTWLFFLPLYVLGLNPLAVSAMLGINLMYQFWLHTDLVGRLGPLEWVLNTPSHHRVHHASNPEYLDRNYGGILIVWDRLFGTLAEENADTRTRYGLVHPVGSQNPLRIAFAGWVAIAHDVARSHTWRERLVQLFGRPGASLENRSPSAALSLETSE